MKDLSTLVSTSIQDHASPGAYYSSCWRKRHPEQYAKIQFTWRTRNPKKAHYCSLRQNAKRKGVPFDLELNDINYPECCPILGIPLVRNTGDKSAKENSPSVDRIDPSKGYTKDNIQIISAKANVMKNNATKEELLRFAEWVLKTYRH